MLPTAYASTSTNKSAIALRKQAQALAKPPFWYSFDYGMAHIVMFDTETDFENAPDEGEGAYKLDGGPFGFSGQQTELLGVRGQENHAVADSSWPSSRSSSRSLPLAFTLSPS